ncbi:hypothetical protein [Methanolobus sp.]|uniref:DUF7286 family protein n=1 Tax=Methanolobus sp. TaxID=1874737 RepID=UPI0025E0F68F|nr:hypothetical protein [Methanolobus sp.]
MRQKTVMHVHSFIHDTRAYIPFAVIGIFVLLFSITSSFYLMKMDYELAETIYQTDGISMEKAAEDIASADLARCLNYAGMEALKWQGEHPIIKSEGTIYEEWGEDRFSVFSKSKEAEPGETIEVNVKLPANILEAIVNIFSTKPRTLIVKGSSGTIYEIIVYDETHSFWSKSEFNEMITIPENATDEYGYLILMYGNDTKATNWFHMGANPVKDITAHHFNRLLQSNYQKNVHTFNNYAINVAPDVQPSKIEIGKINGTLSRQLERSQGEDYTIYYTLTIKDLDYTLVDLSTGTSVNRSMDISTLVTSREPLLAQLTTEYEQALSSRTTSDIVLGATNVRTFTYGPWQYYLNGPLNIVTGPALTSSVNAGTLYTQKRVFDSVDPWATAYTTYYNGKVLYSDISRDSSGYEDEKQSNINTSYANLSSTGSFNVDIDKGINESMSDASTSREEVANNSKLIVSVSNYTDSVYYGWIYNDGEWSSNHPDLLHDVTREVYSATIQGQVFRDGFDDPQMISDYGGYGSHGSKSASGHTVTWKGYYPVLVTHIRALGDNFTYAGTIPIDHSAKISTGKSSWSLTDASVSHLGTDVTCTGILATYSYIGNDALLNETRIDGYLENESRSFDWMVTYIMDFEVISDWKIDYSYDYSSTCYENVNGTLVPYSCTKSSSGSTTLTLVNSGKASHTQTETENITIIYHQYLPSGGYSGVTRNYSPGSSHDYRNKLVSVDGLERPDTDCSDAADKYRGQYIIPNMLSIQSQYLIYPDGKEFSAEKVYCDIPVWLHKVMGGEMKTMFDSINGENPTREIPLLGENLGKDPTLLIQDAALDIVAEMDDPIKKESFARQDQHLTGTMYTTSSDAARAIARSEAYDQLLRYIIERNQDDTAAFGSYIETSFSEKQGSSLLSLLGGDSSLLFNNPAMQKASTALAREMGVIGTMTITGNPHSKYNWTENMTLLIDQYPDYLYHDEDFDLQGQYKWEDEGTGLVVYPLGVRNVCVFSTGIGADIAEILESSSEPLKDSISQSMSQSISEMNTEVNSLIEDIGSESAALITNGTSADTTLIQENRTRLMTNYSASIRSQVPDMVADEVANDPVLSTLISKSEVRTISDSYISTLSDDELVSMVANNTLQEEILFRIHTNIVSENPSISTDEMEAVMYRLEADMRIGVANGVSEAIILSQAVIDECFANINGELQKMLDDSTEKLTGQLAEKMEQRLQRAMKYVPCGLPVLPPNWVCTVNVWEYDVKGAYMTFKVIDNDNECMFNPYLGHEPQVYVRKDERVVHPINTDQNGGLIVIGLNQPVLFEFSGYAATIVGPGPKGVGDKVGERDERSTGYNDFESQF